VTPVTAAALLGAGIFLTVTGAGLILTALLRMRGPLTTRVRPARRPWRPVRSRRRHHYPEPVRPATRGNGLPAGDLPADAARRTVPAGWSMLPTSPWRHDGE
jgi:hypothetical protein